MPIIYVNTDKTFFNANKLGESLAAQAVPKMQEAVVEVMSKEPDFTTTKPGKGYALRMRVLVDGEGRTKIYTVHIEIVRQPPETGKGGKGEKTVPATAKPGSATITGSSEADILDAIVQLATSNAKASLGPMRVDMSRR